MVLEKIDTKKGVSYTDYIDMIEALLEQGKTTGENHSVEMLSYTKLNLSRMKRWNKTLELNKELIDTIEDISGNYLFLVITEAWCGDAAQNIPIIAKICELNESFEMRLLLRDENSALMDQFLTNGSRSIPKVICWNRDTHEEMFVWGPRPTELQEMVMQYRSKKDKEPFDQFSEKVHSWYFNDKGESIQKEFLSLISKLS